MAKVFTKRVCIGDCGTHIASDSVLCGREKCQRIAEEVLAKGLRSLRARTVASTPQPMRIKLLSAAVNHFMTERQPRAVA